jgi:predicted nuclease of predicted toxin-antitoxin system
MDKIRYYMDEHVAKAVMRGLRQRGVDVLSVVDANMLGAKDYEHLEFAFKERRVVFTQDTDFLQLAARGTAHAGIVYAPQHTSVREIIQGLMLLYQVLEAKEMVNHCEFL